MTQFNHGGALAFCIAAIVTGVTGLFGYWWLGVVVCTVLAFILALKVL